MCCGGSTWWDFFSQGLFMELRDYRDSVIAGALSSVLVSGAGFVLGIVGLNSGPEAAWAALIGVGEDTLGWWIGFFVHVLFGALVGIGYLWLFEIFYRFMNHWFVGAIIGILQAAILGFLFGLSPRVCPVLFGCLQGQGFNPSMPDMVAWIGLHAIFGIVVWTLLEDVDEGRRLHRYLPNNLNPRKID
jgi:hypothetical protein